MASSKKKSWEVYIVQTKSGKLYTGITTDVARRFAEHAGTNRGAKFFRVSRPEKIVFREKSKNRSEAAKREMEIKRLSRQEKLRLIERRARKKAPRSEIS